MPGETPAATTRSPSRDRAYDSASTSDSDDSRDERRRGQRRRIRRPDEQPTTAMGHGQPRPPQPIAAVDLLNQPPTGDGILGERAPPVGRGGGPSAAVARPSSSSNGGLLETSSYGSRVLLFRPVDRAVREGHMQKIVDTLLGPELAASRPVTAIERGFDEALGVSQEWMRVAFLHARHAEAVRTAMNGGQINGRVVTCIFAAP